MTISGDNYDLSSSFTNLFKQRFRDDKNVDIFNFENPLLKMIKTSDDFTGTNLEVFRSTGFMGGYGFGSTMPRLNESPSIRPRVTAKKHYVRAGLDTESIAAAMDKPGAFFDLVDRVKMDIKRAIEHSVSLSLFCSNADNDLVLGTIDTGGVSGTNPYTLTISAATWHETKFHVKQIVNIETGNSDPFEVTAVDPDNRQITVSRLSGSQVPAQTDEIFLQGSEANAFTGLPAATAQSGTLYNVTIGNSTGWIARSTDASGAAVDEKMLYNELARVKNKCGEQPNVIICGLTQYLKIAEFLGDKRIIHMPGATDNKGVMGHSMISIDTDSGSVPIMWDRLCPNDTIYLLNTNRIEFIKRPLSGMVTVGGDLLVPDYNNDLDRYLVHYRCYGDLFIEPQAQAVITGLATS